jgi:hypothetical protein
MWAICGEFLHLCSWDKPLPLLSPHFIGHHLAVHTVVKLNVIKELIPDGVLASWTKLFTVKKTFFLNIYCFVMRIEMACFQPTKGESELRSDSQSGNSQN